MVRPQSKMNDMKLNISRRTLVKATSLAALGTISQRAHGSQKLSGASCPNIEFDEAKELAMRALTAASASGASYADVRLTHKFERKFVNNTIVDFESITVGIRSLVNGRWGFAASPLWKASEMDRIGQEATFMAKINTSGKSRPIELSPRRVIRDVEWATPIEIDPFEINPLEILDHMNGLMYYARLKHGVNITWNDVGANFEKTQKIFATTDGCYSRQRLYLSGGKFRFNKVKNREDKAERGLDELTAAGLGWEMWLNPKLKNSIRLKCEEIDEDLSLDYKPVDVGRFNVVLDVASVASLLADTIGAATELDRALGFEANAGGTSYITDPAEMLGSLKIGADTLTVRANRREIAGAATVNHDDEGVEPSDFTVINNGVLNGFQTTRESAGWFSANGIATQQPVTSNGCAHASEGRNIPLAFPANLSMDAGEHGDSYTDLVRSLGDGIAFEGIDKSLDMMLLNGLTLRGRAYEIKKGVKIAKLLGAGMLFRTPELWKSLTKIGGGNSQFRFGVFQWKGEPGQGAWHSVTAVPSQFKEASIVDIRRKA